MVERLFGIEKNNIIFIFHDITQKTILFILASLNHIQMNMKFFGLIILA